MSRAPVPPPYAEAGGRAYHRTLRDERYRWWKPVLGLAVAVGTFIVLLLTVQLVTVIVDASRTGGTVDESLDRLASEFGPLFLANINLSLAVMIPAAGLAVLLVHRRRFGVLSSVAGRLRWGYLLRATCWAVLVAVVFMLAVSLLSLNGTAVESPPTVGFAAWAGIAGVVLLTTPLQAAGEEYMFRGYAMQALGSWLRAPWVPMVLTSLAFGFAHGAQDLPLFLDRFAFGLIACWLVIRTGGLEAAIAMHAVNNMLIFLVAAAFDEVDEELAVSTLPWSLVVLDVLQMLLFAWLAVRAFDRHAATPHPSPQTPAPAVFPR